MKTTLVCTGKTIHDGRDGILRTLSFEDGNGVQLVVDHCTQALFDAYEKGRSYALQVTDTEDTQ